ncbi:MAG: ribosome maturation factor RimP [Lachnospiraceae bacterium]|nr:ribosome maturation factor RimP [Lachnospiraceae bacterium]
MSKRESYEAGTERLLKPIMEANGFELVDVEYVKEGSNYYLRAYIDKPGGINIDDCELVSRALAEKLDAEDFIDTAYILEVSSPGLLRPIKKEKDFQRNMGKPVEVHLYKSQDGNKDYVGDLESYDDASVTIVSDGETRSFLRKEIALLRPYVEFDF